MKTNLIILGMLVLLITGCGEEVTETPVDVDDNGDDEVSVLEKIEVLGFNQDLLNTVEEGIDGEEMVPLLIQLVEHLESINFNEFCKPYDSFDVKEQTTYDGLLTKLTITYQKEVSGLGRLEDVGRLTVITTTKSVNYDRLEDCKYYVSISPSGVKETNNN